MASRAQGSAPANGATLERAGIGVMALRLVAVAMAMMTQVVLAKRLGAEQFGIYGLAASFGLITAHMAGRSTSTLLVRLFGRYDARQEWGLLSGSVRVTRRLALLVSGCAMAVLAVIALTTFSSISKTILLSLLLIPILSMSMLAQASLRGMNRFWAALVPEMLLRNGALLLLVLAYGVASSRPFLAEHAMSLTVLGATIELAAVSALARSALPERARAAAPLYATREWVLAWMPLVMAQLMSMVEQNLTVWLLGKMQPAAEVGLYVAAKRCTDMISLISVSFGFVLGPVVARAFALGAMRDLEAAAMNAARVIATIGIPLIFAAGLFRSEILGIMGSEYAQASSCLLILLAGQLVNVSCGAIVVCLMMMGQVRPYVIILAVSALVDLSLVSVLVPRYGIEGAAVGQAVSVALWNVVLVVLLWQRFGVHATILGYLRRRPATGP